MRIIKFHVIFATVYFLFCYVSDLILDPDTTFVKEIIFFTTQNVFLFYSLFYFLKTFSSKTKADLLVSILRLLVILLVFLGLRYSVRYYLLTNFFDARYGEKPIGEWLTDSILWIVDYLIIASAYFYFVSFIQKQRDLNMIKEEKMADEKEKLELENLLLKAQINPHFLYNTLDFLYAKSLPLSEDLSEGIMKLSDIMRYSLQPHDEQGLVWLTDETEHIRNIIDINKLRFSNKLFITTDFNEDARSVKIIPFVLITLVENAMKHGMINNPEYPAMIKLHINDKLQLQFSTWNRKRNGPKELSTGIGLENTLKRLNNFYEDRYTIEIQDETDFFSVRLNINLIKTDKNYLI
jgi:two-component system LytT family sensor kinase